MGATLAKTKSQKIGVIVSALNGESFSVTISDDSNVAGLKQIIEQDHGMPFIEQDLQFGESPLDNEQILRSVGITNDSTLLLFQRKPVRVFKVESKKFGGVNVRAGNSKESQIVGSCANGTYVVCFEKQRDWVRVKEPHGQSGAFWMTSKSNDMQDDILHELTAAEIKEVFCSGGSGKDKGTQWCLYQVAVDVGEAGLPVVASSEPPLREATNDEIILHTIGMGSVFTGMRNSAMKEKQKKSGWIQTPLCCPKSNMPQWIKVHGEVNAAPLVRLWI